MQEVRLQLGVAVLLGPEIEGHRGDLVNEWLGQSVFCKVNRLQIGLAGVTTFHPNVIKFGRRVHREFGMIFFSAAGAKDAAELPLGEAK